MKEGGGFSLPWGDMVNIFNKPGVAGATTYCSHPESYRWSLKNKPAIYTFQLSRLALNCSITAQQGERGYSQSELRHKSD